MYKIPNKHLCSAWWVENLTHCSPEFTFSTVYKCVCVQAEGDRLPPGHTVSQLETCKIRSIRAGTLERLVETLLTAFGDNDLTYTSIFLSTYRAFTSTQTVLQILLDR